MNRFFHVLNCFVFLGTAVSFARQPVPLMPVRTVSYSSSTSSQASSPASQLRATETAPKNYSRNGFGLELGILGRSNGTSGTALGFEYLWGGRAFMRLALGDKFFLKPGIGYFRRSDSVGTASVSQNIVELSSVIHYSVISSNGLRWLVGVAPRLDWVSSKISAFGSSGTTPSAFQFRLGPTMGLSMNVAPSVNIVTDAEVTFSFTKPSRTYGGVSSGLLFLF